mgnify:CR=1 FL=1
MLFDKLSNKGKCDVCGREDKVVPAASIFGATTFVYCKKCLDLGVEPYDAMVDYIACAGHFPDDVNVTYQVVCREILRRLDIPEEQFIKDVDTAIDNFWKSQEE